MLAEHLSVVFKNRSDIKTRTQHSPVKGHFVSQVLLVDVAVEEVVADVRGGSLHEFDEDLSFCHIEVVAEKLAAVFGLPVEVFGNVAPELCTKQEQKKNIVTETVNSSCWNDTFITVQHIAQLLSM